MPIGCCIDIPIGYCIGIPIGCYIIIGCYIGIPVIGSICYIIGIPVIGSIYCIGMPYVVVVVCYIYIFKYFC